MMVAHFPWRSASLAHFGGPMKPWTCEHQWMWSACQEFRKVSLAWVQHCVRVLVQYNDHVEYYCKCTPFCASSLVISDKQFNVWIGTEARRVQKIPKRLRIGLQGISLSQIGKRALTFMPSSVPNVLTNHSLVLEESVWLRCTRVKSVSRISRAMWVLRQRPYSKSFASSLISEGQLATLTSRCFAHAVRASKSTFLQQNEMCVK